MNKYVVLIVALTVFLCTAFVASFLRKNTVSYTNSPSASPTAIVPEPTNPYTMGEVKKHNSETDCWTVIMGSVYDITPLIDIHTGRPQILQACGVDSSVIFNSERMHDMKQRELLKKHKIGVLTDDK